MDDPTSNSKSLPAEWYQNTHKSSGERTAKRKLAPSNSKSEEHRCEECNSVCQNCNTAPEPPQDTSLEEGSGNSADHNYILEFLKKAYFNARTDVVGEQNGNLPHSKHALPTLGFMAEEILQWHKAEVSNLLQVIEDEVINTHIDIVGVYIGDYDQYKEWETNIITQQRQALKKIKERLHE